MPESADVKPAFGEHGGEIFWMNRNARGELWLNAKEAARKSSRSRKSRRGGADCLVLCDTNGGSLSHVLGDAIERVRERFPGVEVVDTICDATELRQREVVELASRNDCVLVIGAASSSTTLGVAAGDDSARESGRMASDGSCVGVIYVDNLTSTHAYSADDLDFLIGFAGVLVMPSAFAVAIAVTGDSTWNFTTRNAPSVVISQYYEGTTSTDRFIELRNLTGSPLPLTGYLAQDRWPVVARRYAATHVFLAPGLIEDDPAGTPGAPAQPPSTSATASTTGASVDFIACSPSPGAGARYAASCPGPGRRAGE